MVFDGCIVMSSTSKKSMGGVGGSIYLLTIPDVTTPCKCGVIMRLVVSVCVTVVFGL